jgi:hypothetical protein
MLIPLKDNGMWQEQVWQQEGNSLMPPPTLAAANLKRHIHLYLYPDSLPVSSSSNLTQPPPPLLPFCPLVGPANTLVSVYV